MSVRIGIVVPTVTIACLVLACLGCGQAEPPETTRPADSGERACIERVLARDSELGAERNHAPEQGPIADAVRAYVAGMDALDFEGCPADFETAFVRHRDAWDASVAFFERHADRRGEMHDVFDEIRALGGDAEAGLRAVETDIWGTWAEVESASKAP